MDETLGPCWPKAGIFNVLGTRREVKEEAVAEVFYLDEPMGEEK